VATHPALGNVSGEFFEDCNQVEVSGAHHLRDAGQASRLWLRSQALVADYYVTHERPDRADLENAMRGTGARDTPEKEAQ
jgi:hypothetical protein